jgi:hypothetical protein
MLVGLHPAVNSRCLNNSRRPFESSLNSRWRMLVGSTLVTNGFDSHLLHHLRGRSLTDFVANAIKITRICDECRWNYINLRVPGSNPGCFGNKAVAQLVEHHDAFHHHLSSQNFRTSSAPAGALNFACALICGATNAAGNYIPIRRSPGVSPGMRYRISSGKSPGHCFLNHLSSRIIFET